MYRAKDGESLAGIAEMYGYSVEAVAGMNPQLSLKENAPTGQLSLRVNGSADVLLSLGKYATRGLVAASWACSTGCHEQRMVIGRHACHDLQILQLQLGRPLCVEVESILMVQSHHDAFGLLMLSVHKTPVPCVANDVDQMLAGILLGQAWNLSAARPAVVVIVGIRRM